MDSESIYTDNQITKIAENIAEFLLNTFNTKPIGRGVLYCSWECSQDRQRLSRGNQDKNNWR